MHSNNQNGQILLVFFFSVFLIVSCYSQKDLIQEGFIQLRFRDYDSTKHGYVNPAIMPDMNIWYRGNLVIEEIKTISVNDSFGIMTKNTPTAYFLFMDRTSKTFYNYASFNDTARILDKYTQADSAELRGVGGWAFYKNYSLDTIGTPKQLSDTLIDKVNYKRVQLILKGETIPSTIVGYLRCDKQGTRFQFNNEFSQKMGCPLVKMEYLPSLKNRTPSSDELLFVRDSLTKKERRIFDAWEKNVKKYPVTKN